ncbi:hypothetical protein ACFWNK_12945 [Streptomyces sp. NPDC058417]|uniref:hypothetical protein n=1 Tax=unclassified Streptomyces TaxID=2593676 RepID=UPI003661714B
MPGIHFRLRMTDSEIGELAAREIGDLVDRLVPQVFEPVAGAEDFTAEQTRALAHLHLLTYLQAAVDRLEADRAGRAAAAGAGYPQIGRASNLTRQGARRRWPDLLDPSDRTTGPPRTAQPPETAPSAEPSNGSPR